MSRKKTEINPIRADRVKKIIEWEGISQKAFAKLIFQTQQNVSRILNQKVALTEETAQTIINAFPEKGYRIEWLLGYDEHATQKEELLHKVEKLNENGSLLWKGFLSFASLSGFHTEIASIPGEKFMDTFKNMKEYCTISRDGKSITLSMAELNSFTEELCDYVEFRLTHMMK